MLFTKQGRDISKFATAVPLPLLLPFGASSEGRPSACEIEFSFGAGGGRSQEVD